jgi:hypothetical protein
MSSLRFELATAGDDPELRRLLRENPIPGSISLSFEREPNYFSASAIEGEFHQTIVAREADSKWVIAFGNRSARPLYVNGSVSEVGYMSQLRVDPSYGKGLYLARGLAGGFKKFHELHRDGRAPFYLMSVIEENLAARRLLTSNLPEYPQAREYTRMFTYAVYPLRKKHDIPLPRGLTLQRGSREMIPSIVDCLNRNGARKQFALHWDENTLPSPLTPALAVDDFFLALSGTRVVGCLALWNQSSFKQTVVRGYAGALARFRPAINALSPLGLFPYLPQVGATLRQAYACLLAVDDDDPAVFAALFRALYNEAVRRKFHYFTIGLAEAHPFHDLVKAYRPLKYTSRIYLTGWDKSFEETSRVDRRIPHIEIAVL